MMEAMMGGGGMGGLGGGKKGKGRGRGKAPRSAHEVRPHCEDF